MVSVLDAAALAIRLNQILKKRSSKVTKIYVASSWRNEFQWQVVHELRRVGHEVYDFRNPKPGDDGFHWSEIDPDWERSWLETISVQIMRIYIAAVAPGSSARERATPVNMCASHAGQSSLTSPRCVPELCLQREQERAMSEGMRRALKLDTAAERERYWRQWAVTRYVVERGL